MNYEEFKGYIQNHILEKFPEEYRDSQISIIPVPKNNNTIKDCLNIMKNGDTIAPILYIENYFEQYQTGRNLDDIMENIATHYFAAERKFIDPDRIFVYNYVKERIIPRLRNMDENAELLSKVPFTPIEDLAVTYHILMEKTDSDITSASITNDMMEKYGVDTETLHENAVENIKKLTPSRFTPMVDVLKSLMTEMLDDGEGFLEDVETTELDPDLYVVTNNNGVYGASAILDTKFMDKITKHIGHDVIVLPSSVHEVLIMPKQKDMNLYDLKQLEDMVRDINNTQVIPSERLSNHVYEYHADSHSLVRSDHALLQQQQKQSPVPSSQKENPIKTHANLLENSVSQQQEEISR